MTSSPSAYDVQPDATVTIYDEAGRSLRCQVEQTFAIDQETYALLIPIDTPVQVFAWSEEEEGEEVLIDIHEADLEPFLPTAQAVLAEQGLQLQHTAITLTVTGELPELNEDDCFTLSLDDEVLAGAEAEDSQEVFQVLATFFEGDVEHTICTPVDPLLVFARLLSAEKAQVIAPEEFEQLRPHIEAELFDELD